MGNLAVVRACSDTIFCRYLKTHAHNVAVLTAAIYLFVPLSDVSWRLSTSPTLCTLFSTKNEYEEAVVMRVIVKPSVTVYSSINSAAPGKKLFGQEIPAVPRRRLVCLFRFRVLIHHVSVRKFPSVSHKPYFPLPSTSAHLSMRGKGPIYLDGRTFKHGCLTSDPASVTTEKAGPPHPFRFQLAPP